MADTESLEQQIRDVLRTEPDALRLSDALFRPDGLFARMASTKEERRSVTQSPLFQEAQKRLAELRRREADEFSKAVDQSQHAPDITSPRLHRSEQV